MKNLMSMVFGTGTGRDKGGRRRGQARRSAVRPEVRGLEERQLLSAFARGFDTPLRNDLAVYQPSGNMWYIDYASTNYTTSASFQWGQAGDIPVFNSDFLGTGHADIAVFQPNDGMWYIKDPISGQTAGFAWGQQGDVPIGSTDFFGNGRADLVVFQPSNGMWYIKDPLSGQTAGIQWGTAGDVPVGAARFDGDARADLEVYRPSDQTWHVLTSTSGYSAAKALNYQWGASGDVPLFNSDFFGDGRNDFAVYRPSDQTWYVLNPATGQQIRTLWGLPGDIPLANSNFFGNGHADLAVFRPSNGTWYVKDPMTSKTITKQLGMAGDEPLTDVNFDSDAWNDMAVYRPSDGSWHILTSSSNFTTRMDRAWGASGDEAVGAPAGVDPILTLTKNAVYKSFQGDPLFATDGPSPSDIAQGNIGDCSVLSRLHAIAEADPARVRRMIFDMGNGLYGVDLQPLGQDQYVVVDADLPVWSSNGQPAWAKLGHQNSLWVPLIEKAWAFAKPVPSNVYLSAVGNDVMLDGAGFGTLWDAMGFTSTTVSNGGTGAFLIAIENAMASGQDVVVGTNYTVANGSQLVGNHCYHFEGLSYFLGQVNGVVLYNPWGTQVIVSVADFLQNVNYETSARV